MSDEDSDPRAAREASADPQLAALAAESFQSIAADKNLDIETRLTAANALADLDPQAAARALLSIAEDPGVYIVSRLTAADALAALDPQAAARALLSIAQVAYDRQVAGEFGQVWQEIIKIKILALQKLIPLNGDMAVSAARSLAVDTNIDENTRCAALRKMVEIPGVNVQAAAAMLHSIATASGETPVTTAVRLTAAQVLGRLLGGSG